MSKNNVKPTERQKKAFANVVENGCNKRKGLKDAGYSEAVAHNPKKVTDSEGWEKLMEEYIPDDLLSKVHSEGLEASKGVFKNNNETKKVERVDDEPDFGVRHKYLDTAYKLKGKYAAEKKEITGEVKIVKNNKELDTMAEKVEEELKDKKTNEV